MSYDVIHGRMQIRPIQKWPGEPTPDSHRKTSPFSATWRQTMRLLDTELYNIGAEGTVLQVAMEDADFRIDGLPRANAKAKHPGVILGLNPNGRVGDRLEFATDVFRGWEDNLRAIALGLEALRKVDRYGITSGSQQYAGFRAITVGDDGSLGLYSKAQALDYIEKNYGGDLKAALKKAHPDLGGDAEELRRVVRAKELIGA